MKKKAVELTDITPAELSRVRRAATGRKALLLKSEDNEMKMEMLNKLGELLDVQADGEADVSDVLKAAGIESEDAINAAVAATRLIKHFEDELDEDVRKSLAEKIFGAEITTPEPVAESDESDEGEEEKVSKALDTLPEDVREVLKAEREEREFALTELRKERRARERDAIIKMAEEELGVLATTPEDLADVVQAARENLPAEDAEKLEKLLRATASQVESDLHLMKSYGVDGSGSVSTGAWDDIQKAAEKLLSDGEVPTIAQGVAKAIKRDPKLAEQYNIERQTH